jgi:hypothetical protein
MPLNGNAFYNTACRLRRDADFNGNFHPALIPALPG